MEDSPDPASEAAVLAHSDEGDTVLVTNDADEIAAGFADEWVSVDARGYTTKAELIDWIRSGRLAHHSMRTAGDLRVQVSGDTAILTARKASTGAWEGAAYSTEEWITDVLQWRDGCWVCVFTHKTPIV